MTAFIESHRNLFGIAAIFAASQAYGAEPPVTEKEYDLVRNAVCAQNKLLTATPAQIQVCENFIAARKGKFTLPERVAGVDAVCLERHKAHHISFSQACRNDLYVQYKLPVPPVVVQGQAAAVPVYTQRDALKSCATGAAKSTLTVLLIQGGALVLDGLGCAGACSALAPSVSGLTLAGGCARQVISDAPPPPN